MSHQSSQHRHSAIGARNDRDHSPVSQQPAAAVRMPDSGAAGRQPRCDKIELEEFVKALKEIIFAEREVESTKIELALKSDFNIVDAFKMMDVRGAGAIAQQDLKDGLTQNLGFMDFSSDDLYLLYRRFDRGNCGSLTFNDFNRAVLPFSREYANLIKDRADFYSRRSRDGSGYFN